MDEHPREGLPHGSFPCSSEAPHWGLARAAVKFGSGSEQATCEWNFLAAGFVGLPAVPDVFPLLNRATLTQEMVVVLQEQLLCFSILLQHSVPWNSKV